MRRPQEEQDCSCYGRGERRSPDTREGHSFLQHARVIEQAEEGKRKDSGQDRDGVPDQGVMGARPPAHRRLEEEVRRRSQRREDQRLPREESRQPAHCDGQRGGDEGVESFSCPLTKALCEPLMEAIPLLVSHQDATRSACGAACFMRVLSHFICVAVCPSQVLTVSSSSLSYAPWAACPIMVHEMSQALAIRYRSCRSRRSSSPPERVSPKSSWYRFSGSSGASSP